MRLAEGVYEQTQDLGPTPLQGRLNYLHQLGKVTLRDRRESLNSLPRKREEMEFAVSVSILAYIHCKLLAESRQESHISGRRWSLL